jgi:phytanoyl-CoA hydroxylase
MGDMELEYTLYQRAGYVVIPEVLSREQLSDFLANEARVPAWGSGPQPLQRFKAELHWLRLVSNERILSILSLLMRCRPRIVEAIYLPKPAAGNRGSQGVAFHRDIDHIRAEPPELIGCWIALNDTDVENGGLCVLPGTHVVEPALLAETTSTARGFDIRNEMRDRDGRVWIDCFRSDKFSHLDPDQIVPLSVPSRAAVFFHGSLVHGSFANMSLDRDRLAVSAHYVGEDSWVFRTDLQQTMGFA